MSLEETARVLRVEGDHVVLVREQVETCFLCSDPEECSSTQEEMRRCNHEIRAWNRAGAGPGDLVRVRLEGGQLLLAIMLAYGLPVASMILGAMVGIQLASSVGLDSMVSQGVGALALGISLLLSVTLSRWIDRQLHRREFFTPRVEEIRESAPRLEV